jgi:hypothetical protein
MGAALSGRNSSAQAPVLPSKQEAPLLQVMNWTCKLASSSCFDLLTTRALETLDLRNRRGCVATDTVVSNLMMHDTSRHLDKLLVSVYYIQDG